MAQSSLNRRGLKMNKGVLILDYLETCNFFLDPFIHFNASFLRIIWPWPYRRRGGGGTYYSLVLYVAVAKQRSCHASAALHRCNRDVRKGPRHRRTTWHCILVLYW